MSVEQIKHLDQTIGIVHVYNPGNATNATMQALAGLFVS